MASGRPGGNPEFGKTIKIDAAGTEPLERLLNIRITASMDEFLRGLGDRRLQFVREAIAEKLERELATLQTKIVATELETETGREPADNQTTQEAQEPETNPTPGEQGENPKTRRKATQTQGQKPNSPTTRSRSQKNTVTETEQAIDQPDKLN
ncbi:hypothetical protein [uncultured Nostoc sp.]|uniref:hypothetical protein n=1 Tax=uncultured Nostoc sp. TaxID=340711 RepID=UPI0035CB0CDA